MKRYFFLMTASVGLVFSALAGDWVYDGTTSPATIRDAESDWNWKLKVAGPLTDGAITITDWVSGSGATSGVLDLRDFTVGGEASIVPIPARPILLSDRGTASRSSAADRVCRRSLCQHHRL